jgi:hypothetical protein
LSDHEPVEVTSDAELLRATSVLRELRGDAARDHYAGRLRALRANAHLMSLRVEGGRRCRSEGGYEPPPRPARGAHDLATAAEVGSPG